MTQVFHSSQSGQSEIGPGAESESDSEPESDAEAVSGTGFGHRYGYGPWFRPRRRRWIHQS
jgi:hypothetical protein